MGVHSTQRSESIHSAIKNFIGATTLLVQLATKLVTYQADLDESAALHVTRTALRRVTTHYNDLPCVAAEANRLSDHAMEILRAQQAMQQSYIIKPHHIPDGFPALAGLYEVYLPEVSSDPQASAVNAIADDTPLRLAEDHGLPTGTSCARRASLLSCTCQFHSCWGLPCRHMLWLYQHFQVPLFIQGVISPRWGKHDIDDPVEKRRMLLRTLPREHIGQLPSRPLNRREIFCFLSSESKAVIEVASQSEEGMQVFLDCLDNAKQRLVEMHASATHNHAPTVQNPVTSAGAASDKALEKSLGEVIIIVTMLLQSNF